MGHTNSTVNYNLPQFIGTDKPSWLGDVNGAFLAIDTAIAAAKTQADSAAGGVASLQNTVGSHTTQIGTLTDTVTTQGGTLNSVTALIGNGTPTTTDQTIIGAINELHADMVPILLKDISGLSVSGNTAYDTELGTATVKQYKYISVAIKTDGEPDRWRKIFIPIFSDDVYVVGKSYYISAFVDGVYYSRSIDVDTNEQAHITVKYGISGYSEVLTAVRIVGYK